MQTELENNKADVYLLTQMANVLWNLGKDEEALAFIEKAQESNSGYPLMLFTKGRLLWSLERYEEAIAVWDMLLRSETTYLSEHGWGKRWAKSISNDALFYKALCLSALHRIKEAKLLMEEHLSKRRVGQESDFTAKEAKEFLRRLTYSSGKTIAYENEERGWASSKQWQNMEKQFAKKKNDKLEFVAYLKRKAREFPHEYYLKTLLAEELLELGKYSDALRYAEKAFRQESTDWLVVYDYGNALYHNGKYNEAFQVLEMIQHTNINIIAYGDHGEGMRWAKTLLKDTEQVIGLCTKSLRKDM